MRKPLIIVMLTLGLLGWMVVQQATAQGRDSGSRPTVSQHGDLTSFSIPSAQAQAGGPSIDFVHAQPMPLPSAPSRSAEEAQADMIDALTSQAPPVLGAPGYSPGGRGNGVMNPVILGPTTPSAGGVTPEEFGTTDHPFSTSQADLSVPTNTYWPYRASGKLFFQKTPSGGTFVCSASLIKRGIVVVAAHCVANYGASQFYTNWQFVPGYRNGGAPYGVWAAAQVWIKTRYYNGTDACAQYGVICPDDVAVITLAAQSGAYPGTNTGWYGYGWNGWGFTSGGLTQITQIGYPVCLDNGLYMERNDSYGYVSGPNSNNTIIGSLMCGGSSGGPWLVNFGRPATLTGTTNGTYASHNIVVGVTSWGYTSNDPKEQGASPFTDVNVVSLVNSACGSIPAACS